MVAHGGASVGMQGFIGNNTGFGLPANGFGTQASSEVAVNGANSSRSRQAEIYAGDLTASASYRDADEQTQVGIGL